VKTVAGLALSVPLDLALIEIFMLASDLSQGERSSLIVLGLF
jgi:hypothetical protein